MDKAKIDKMSGTFSRHERCYLHLANRILDQQIGQMYELMQAIQRQNQEDADAEEAAIVNSLNNHLKPEQ
jgi:hypothetical protein